MQRLRCVWGKPSWVNTIWDARRVALRIISGKNIYNFGIAERLRTLRYPIFTGGVTPLGAAGNFAATAEAFTRRGKVARSAG